ncbi:hypothetical protein ACGFX4_07835 [Kitasatospora sp. NPDC048365]|uniref:hypothetical protein n=1 Tax=Kitasatospora sp. NPDC048365 TaxID=3364050 RepID=UPI0037197694
MTQTAQHTEPVTGLVPAPRRPLDPEPAPAAEPRTPVGELRRAFAVLRGLRTLRPVAARPQPGYGEVDGQ